jgi:hypothetical protein
VPALFECSTAGVDQEQQQLGTRFTRPSPEPLGRSHVRAQAGTSSRARPIRLVEIAGRPEPRPVPRPVPQYEPRAGNMTSCSSPIRSAHGDPVAKILGPSPGNGTTVRLLLAATLKSCLMDPGE